MTPCPEPSRGRPEGALAGAPRGPGGGPVGARWGPRLAPGGAQIRPESPRSRAGGPRPRELPPDPPNRGNPSTRHGPTLTWGRPPVHVRTRGLPRGSPRCSRTCGPGIPGRLGRAQVRAEPRGPGRPGPSRRATEPGEGLRPGRLRRESQNSGNSATLPSIVLNPGSQETDVGSDRTSPRVGPPETSVSASRVSGLPSPRQTHRSGPRTPEALVGETPHIPIHLSISRRAPPALQVILQ